MTESVGQSWKADRALYVATAVLFIVVLVSGVVARAGRPGDHVQGERPGLIEQERLELAQGEQTVRLEEEFVLSLSAFLSVAAVTVYGIRRRRGGRAPRRVVDPLRSLEIGLAVGLALTAGVLALILAIYGWLDGDQQPRSVPWPGFSQSFTNWVAAVPSRFAERLALLRRDSFPVGLEYFESLGLHRLPKSYPDKRLQAWIEFACLNTLGWCMVLSPAVHHVRRGSGRRSPRIDAGRSWVGALRSRIMQRRTAILDAVSVVYLILLSLKMMSMEYGMINSDDDILVFLALLSSMPIVVGTVVHLLSSSGNALTSVACMWAVTFAVFYTILHNLFEGLRDLSGQGEHLTSIEMLLLALAGFVAFVFFSYPLLYMSWIRKRKFQRYFNACAWIYAAGCWILLLGWILREYVDYFLLDTGRMYLSKSVHHFLFMSVLIYLTCRLTRGARGGDPEELSSV